MKAAFDALKHFFVGASYSVFAVGCVLAVVSDEFSYATFFASFLFAVLLLILGWVSALAGRGL
jgi:uncharacterized membrane protein